MILSKHYARDARREILFSANARLCLLGIGGVSMHALAHFCHAQGFSVFGADRRESENTKRLREEGIRVLVPCAGAVIDEASAVVCSLALDETDPDVLRAREKNIPILTRGELLGALMEDYAVSVAVSGSHGKSTVTAALASVLSAAGKDPSVLSGASLAQSTESYRIGGRGYLVAEACEYGDSFLSLRPSLSLLLNLEWDHPDYFSSEESLSRSFARFAMGSGTVLYFASSPALSRMVEAYGIRNALSVGRDASCDYRYEITALEDGCATLRFFDGKRAPMELRLSVPGRFQAENAAMVLAAASYLGVESAVAATALSRFRGIERRLSRVASYTRLPLYYDYAHHPTEIRTSIEALREMHGAPVTVLFRPHTFSRTAALFSDFVSALSCADRVFITDIDGARERGGAVTAEALSAAVGGVYVPLERAKEAIEAVEDGSAVLMGAGDLSVVFEALKASVENS